VHRRDYICNCRAWPMSTSLFTIYRTYRAIYIVIYGTYTYIRCMIGVIYCYCWPDPARQQPVHISIEYNRTYSAIYLCICGVYAPIYIGKVLCRDYICLFTSTQPDHQGSHQFLLHLRHIAQYTYVRCIACPIYVFFPLIHHGHLQET
jgi:hypothetical protein